MPRTLWEHPNPRSTAMYRFMQLATKKYGLDIQVRAPPSDLHFLRGCPH